MPSFPWRKQTSWKHRYQEKDEWAAFCCRSLYLSFFLYCLLYLVYGGASKRLVSAYGTFSSGYRISFLLTHEMLVRVLVGLSLAPWARTCSFGQHQCWILFVHFDTVYCSRQSADSLTRLSRPAVTSATIACWCFCSLLCGQRSVLHSSGNSQCDCGNSNSSASNC